MDKEFNLEVLHKQFFVKGKAGKGYRGLLPMIRKRQTRELKVLLRDHREKEITLASEIKFRDNVDYLLEYVSVLYIGRLAGYLPGDLPARMTSELITILENEQMREFYNKFYKQAIPGFFLKSIKSVKPLKKDNMDREMDILFERFLILNNTIAKDDDTDQFLWFLDDGYTDDYDIQDLIGLLKNKKQLHDAIKDDDEDILESSLQGYIKYLNYLDQYSDLLQAASKFPEFAAALYLYQEYWFAKIKRLMKSVFLKGIVNIQKAIYQVSREDYSKLVGPNEGEYVSKVKTLNTPLQYDEWMDCNKYEIDKVQSSLKYLHSFRPSELKQILRAIN